jgi:hypothetical protein
MLTFHNYNKSSMNTHQFKRWDLVAWPGWGGHEKPICECAEY